MSTARFAGTSLFSLALLLAASAASAEETRALKAHQHGHGTLNIAIDGATIAVELEAPGADIVGFEHTATTQADKAALNEAKAKLADARFIVALPDAAQCKLAEANIKLETDHASDHDDSHADHDAAHGNDHSAFLASYSFQCGQISNVTSIELPYFKTFAKAEELVVTIITGRGQSQVKATAATATLDLTSLVPDR